MSHASNSPGTFIADYIESRRSSDRPISTADAIREVRSALPLLDLSDRQLADLVAETAIGRGRNVAFDLGRDQR